MNNIKSDEQQLYPTYSCTGCGTCCTVPIVPVTDSDIRRLTKATGIDASRLVRFYTPSEIDFDRDAEVWIRFNYGRRAMGLRKRLDRCLFLDDTRRCTVYEARPMTCRTFPYVVDFDENNSTTVSQNDILPCQATAMPPSTLHQILSDTLTEDEEDEAYFGKIRDWNTSVSEGGTQEFLKWCSLQ